MSGGERCPRCGATDPVVQGGHCGGCGFTHRRDLPIDDAPRSRYARTIPRDLFNEASLLKCLGKLVVCLDNVRSGAAFDDAAFDRPSEGFQIVQDPSDGAISVENLPLILNGRSYRLYRPLNSREPWPLWCVSPFSDHDADDVEVFTAEGELSPDFLAMIGINQ